MKKMLAGMMLALISTLAFARAPSVWYGDDMWLFTDSVKFHTGDTRIIKGDLNPSTTAVEASPGSMYISSNGQWYRKTDTGSSTNWVTSVWAEVDPVYIADPAFTITAPQIASWDIAYGWGNHASAGYWVENAAQIASWDIAYGWGNHASAGYWVENAAQIASWDIAYGWGNHASYGYLTSVVAIADGGTGQTTANAALNALLPAQAPASAGLFLQSDGTNTLWAAGAGEVDPVYSGDPAFTITAAQIASWDIAYGWNNHASAGYWVANAAQIASWDIAYGWGNHASAGYLTAQNWTREASTSSLYTTTSDDKVLVGANSNTTDFSATQMVVSNGNSGKTSASTLAMSIEAARLNGAVGAVQINTVATRDTGTPSGSVYSLYAVTETPASADFTVYGAKAETTNAGDGSSYGVHSTMTGSAAQVSDDYNVALYGHADGNQGVQMNFGVYASASGSAAAGEDKAIFATGSDYSFYGDEGVLYNEDSVGIGTASPATPLDVNGIITATGGNSTQWNTTYGWGNHASAGYMVGNPSMAGTVGSNALTIALKTLAGNDPSAGEQVCVNMRSATVTSGVITKRCVAAALSTVVSSGSTAGFASGSTRNLYIYLIDNAGTLELAWSARRIHTEPSNNGLVTTVAEGGAGAADSAATVYSATQRTALPFVLVGKMVFSLTTAGTWDENPDAITLAPFEMEPMVSDYGKTTTTIANATATDIVFSTVRQNTHDLYDTTTGIVTVIENGTYSITGQIYTASITPRAATTQGSLDISIDGAESAHIVATADTTTARSISMNNALTTYLTAGQTVKIIGWQNWVIAGIALVNGQGYCSFQVARVK